MSNGGSVENLMEEDFSECRELIRENISEESLVDELTLRDLEIFIEDGPGKTTPQIKNITYRHKRIAQLIALGLNKSKVAEVVGCQTTTITRLLNNEAFKLLLEEELDLIRDRDDVIKIKLNEVAERGLEKLHEILSEDDVSHRTAKEITMEVLDRSGHGPTKTVQGRIEHGLNKHTLDRIKQDAGSARRYNGENTSPKSFNRNAEVEEAIVVSSVGGADGQASVSTAEESEGSNSQRLGLPAEILEAVKEGSSN